MVSPRNRPRSVRFRFRFFSGFVFKTDRNRPTFWWKTEKPTEPFFIFGSQPCWRHNKTKRGIPILSRYTSFWQKYLVCLNFQNAEQRYTINLPPVYGTSASLRYIQQQNQEGDNDVPFTVTVYRFITKSRGYLFVLVFFLVVAKKPECRNQAKI